MRHLLLLCVGAQTGCPEEPPPAPVRVCASLPGKPYFSVEGRKLFAGKRRRRLREFAPPSPESLILPLRGANPSPGNPPGASASLRPPPGKALFLRYGAQTLHPEKPRRRCEFAPHSRESLILPLRGANPSPGKAPGGSASLRPPPWKALFLRRETQTFHPEEQPAAAGVCAPLPGKAYSSVERRKPFTRKSPRRRWEFAPPSRESLISPSRDANLSPGRAAVDGGSLRLPPGKALFFRRGAQTLRRGIRPEPVRVCASLSGKPYSSVERRKPFTGKSRRRRCEFAPPSRESLILPLRGANLSPGKAPGGCESLRLPPGKALFFR